jgi:REP element-mobilizing transposase RayT
MKFNHKIHHRRSIRMREYDYSQEGAYFVTICTYGKECLYGEVIDGKMRLNEYGKIIEVEWLKTAQIRNNVLMDEYVIMPNHIHGIVVIADDGGSKNCRGTACCAPRNNGIIKGAARCAPTFGQFGKIVSGSLPAIVRAFKSATNKQINQSRRSPGDKVWQRSYYEHVIRDENDYLQIREYIINNPMKWEFDQEHPKNIK